MTTPTSLHRDTPIWQIKEILSDVGPEDMTDAELAGALAIFRLPEVRLPGNKLILRITPVGDGTSSA